VFHPNDWYSTGFLLAKDGVTGGYLIGDPRASVDQLNQLWGLKVVVSEAMTENTALVGDFRQAVLWEREGVSLMVSDQHADFFTRNLLAILAEMRAAFGVLDVQAFCEVTAL
jgi:HK97 family phage major capsid protein